MRKAKTQDMAPFPGDTWNGGVQFILKSYDIGDYVKFWINIPEGADYTFTARFIKAGDYGIAQHEIDGLALGGPVDLYDPAVRRTGETALGTLRLSPGLHELTVRIAGKNPASSGYFYGLDYLKVEKAGG